MMAIITTSPQLSGGRAMRSCRRLMPFNGESIVVGHCFFVSMWGDWSVNGSPRASDLNSSLPELHRTRQSSDMFTRRVLTAASRSTLKARSAVVAPTGVRAVHVEANTSSIQAAIQSEKVLVFSKTYCPYCARVKALFEDLEVNHEVVELDERSDGAQIQGLLLELTKQRTVPNVFINGKHIGGCDSVMELHGKKELEPLLK